MLHNKDEEDGTQEPEQLDPLCTLVHSNMNCTKVFKIKKIGLLNVIYFKSSSLKNISTKHILLFVLRNAFFQNVYDAVFLQWN